MLKQNTLERNSAYSGPSIPRPLMKYQNDHESGMGNHHRNRYKNTFQRDLQRKIDMRSYIHQNDAFYDDELHI